MKINPLRFSWPLLFLFTCFIVGYVLNTNAAQKPDTSRPQTVTVIVAPVIRQDVPLQIQAVGTVLPFQTVAIKSRLDSQIMDVKFKDGDEVHKGDILFLLDDRSIKARINQAEANLTRDKSQIGNLQRQYERNQTLISKQAISQQVLEDSKAAIDAQKAIVAADKSAIEDIQVEMDYATIKAPIDGRTGTINITIGNNVKANDTNALVTINQIQPILVQAALPQDNFDSIRKAMNASTVNAYVSKDAGNSTEQGTLEYLDNSINPGTGTFAVRASFPNKGENLWPGMLATLTIKIGEDKQILTVPEVAVQSATGGQFVFVVANNRAQKRPIKISRIENAVAVVTEGLQENEQIVIDGMMALKDNASVTIGPESNTLKNGSRP